MSGREAAILFGAGLPLLVAVVLTAERKGAFRGDAFATPLRKRTALCLLVLMFAATSLLPAASAGGALDTSRLRFPQLFASQGLLAAFLAAWWLLAGRPPLLDFLGLRSRQPLAEIGAGLCLGPIGWAVTFVLAIVVALLVAALGIPGPRGIPPLVEWIARLSAGQRALVVLSAMTLEEFYFRGFLQRRLGALPASGFFLLAHGGYGEPFFFVGLLGITAILAAAYHRTRSTLAPIAAHGAFNAIQLFLILPAALRVLGGP